MLHEALEEPGVVLLVVAERPEQGEQRQAALAGHPHSRGDLLAGLLLHVELDPLASVGVDSARHELVLGQVAQAVALAGLEDHAGRAHELGHDNPLGAGDDEGALGGHHGEVAHEDDLLLDLARARVEEAGPHEDRRGVGHVLLLAVIHRELGRRMELLVVWVELELETQCLAVVGDGRDIPEGAGQALVHQPGEALPLDRDEVGKFEDLLEISERVAFA